MRCPPRRWPSCVAPVLIAAIAPLASAEQGLGCRPPTAEEQAALDGIVVITDRVLPNRMALDRVNAERQLRGEEALPVDYMPIAEDGAEIDGGTSTGTRSVSAQFSTPLAEQVAAFRELVGAEATILPTAVDNSANIWFPPVGNQGSLGSCASFSSAYYVGTYMLARAANRDVRAVDNTNKLSPKFCYNMINGGTDSGSWMSGCYAVLQTNGAPMWSDWPYDSNFREWPTTAAIWRKAIANRMGEQGAIYGLDTPSGLAKAKQMLANGWIFTFACDVNGFQFTTFKNDPATAADDALTGKKVVTYGQVNASGHAMTIVGYNDEAWTDINGNSVVDAGEKGAFKYVNQWGTGYGNGGFAWFAYDALANASAVAGAVQTNRQALLWSKAVYWLAARPAGYVPSLLAEATVSTAKRNAMYMSLGHGDASAIAPTTTWSTSALSGDGGAYGFTGTTTAVTASFVLDFSDIADSIGPRRWFLRTFVAGTGSPCTISAFKLTDAAGATLATCAGTDPAGGLPRVADNSTLNAWAEYTMPGDAAAPAAIDDLAEAYSTKSSIALSLTAPGDDGMVGRADAYDVRWSTAPITEADFTSATAAANPPLPATGGSPQQILINGLAANTAYHVAVKTRDEAGNWSALSNVVQAATKEELVITSPATLPAAVVGAPYAATLSATGGIPPYTWAKALAYVEDSTGTAPVAGGGTAMGWRSSAGLVSTYSFANGFTFPIGDFQATQVAVSTNGQLSFTQAGAGNLSIYVYSTALDTTGAGEDVYIAAAADQVAIRWIAHEKGKTGVDGSVVFQAILFSSGDIRMNYGPISISASAYASNYIYHGGTGFYLNGSRAGADAIGAGATSLFSAFRLPAGLSLDAATGVISGTPTAVGERTVVARVTDAPAASEAVQTASRQTAIPVVAASQAIIASTSIIAVPEGGSATAAVRLSAAPAGPLTVAIARTSGDGDLSASPASLSFTGSDWSTPKVVTFQASQDGDTAAGQASFACTAGGWTAAALVASEIDDDNALVVASTAITVTEGGSAGISVRLAAAPPANVTVSGSRISGDADLAPQASALTFTPANWATPQNLLVAAAEDVDVASGSAIIRLTAAGLAAVDVTVTEADNDTLAIVASANAITVGENATATFQVKLSHQPNATTAIAVARISGDADIGVSGGAALSFTTASWNTWQTVTLAAAEDGDFLNGTAVFRCSGSGLANLDATATENDNDNQPPTVAITFPAAAATIEAGDQLTITAAAADDHGLQQVEFLLDGTTSLGVVTTPPLGGALRGPQRRADVDRPRHRHLWQEHGVHRRADHRERHPRRTRHGLRLATVGRHHRHRGVESHRRRRLSRQPQRHRGRVRRHVRIPSDRPR